MLAYAQKSRIYPVLLPHRAERPAPRRVRPGPTTKAVAVALVIVLPALFYVYQRTQLARTGYLILQMQRDVHTLQAERDRLMAAATALKTPERVEQIATAELGMVPPRPQQLATLTLAPAVAATPASGGRSVWDQLRGWLSGEAEARETRETR